MSQQTVEQLAQRVFDLGLITDRQLQQVWGELGSRHVAADDFLQLLVRREFLTNYQVERLLKGEKSGFFFGDYKVLYLVGAGSFARVYRAVHKETGKVVAIKVLRKRFSENPAQYRQFIREGLLGKSLRHENIVPIFEVVSKKAEHFLVMEFIEGRNLREFVKVRKKVEPFEAVRLMSEITNGLQYAFERALTHRDLKISNVLVSSHGTAKLVDFGLASIDVTLNDSSGLPTAASPNTRTVDYAALERVTGVRRDDSRSDIYFLGCIFYHMLTGRPALKETRDRVQRLAKTRFLEVDPVQKVDPSIPHSVSIVTNKAMALDPERRYQTPGAMLSDLQIAARRLSDADQDGENNDNSSQAAASAAAIENRLSVMVVESNGEMQNVFRNGFKRAGYRVLITSNPQLVFARFQQEPDTTDCIIFNAQEVGRPALEVFNRFAESESTRSVPALLLLDENQLQWKSQARMAPHRLVLAMPLTMRKLRAALTYVTSRQTAGADADSATDAAAADG